MQFIELTKNRCLATLKGKKSESKSQLKPSLTHKSPVVLLPSKVKNLKANHNEELRST